jgi:hypothetical protein
MSLEHIFLSDPDFDRIANLVQKSYKNSCIVRIERVHINRDAFEARATSLVESEKDPDIVEFFHGTKVKYVTGILEGGFKVSESRTQAYGPGTYFSPSASCSLQGYTDKSKDWNLSYVFLCDVIKADTGGNKSNIYVCPKDYSCVPTFLISFYKDADKIK